MLERRPTSESGSYKVISQRYRALQVGELCLTDDPWSVSAELCRSILGQFNSVGNIAVMGPSVPFQIFITPIIVLWDLF